MTREVGIARGTRKQGIIVVVWVGAARGRRRYLERGRRHGLGAREGEGNRVRVIAIDECTFPLGAPQTERENGCRRRPAPPCTPSLSPVVLVDVRPVLLRRAALLNGEE